MLFHLIFLYNVCIYTNIYMVVSQLCQQKFLSFNIVGIIFSDFKIPLFKDFSTMLCLYCIENLLLPLLLTPKDIKWFPKCVLFPLCLRHKDWPMYTITDFDVKKRICLFLCYVYEYFSCMYICMLHLYLVSAEVKCYWMTRIQSCGQW